MMKKFFLLPAFLFCSMVLLAQDNQGTVGKFMRGNDKIYVVMAVALAILAGLFLYLLRLDRRISRMEKEEPDEKINLK